MQFPDAAGLGKSPHNWFQLTIFTTAFIYSLGKRPQQEGREVNSIVSPQNCTGRKDETGKTRDLALVLIVIESDNKITVQVEPLTNCNETKHCMRTSVQ